MCQAVTWPLLFLSDGQALATFCTVKGAFRNFGQVRTKQKTQDNQAVRSTLSPLLLFELSSDSWKLYWPCLWERWDENYQMNQEKNERKTFAAHGSD